MDSMELWRCRRCFSEELKRSTRCEVMLCKYSSGIGDVMLVCRICAADMREKEGSSIVACHAPRADKMDKFEVENASKEEV